MTVYRDRLPVEKLLNVVTGGNCDLCGKQFQFGFFDDTAHESDQFKDCLHITFHAGYGESRFMDGSADVELCDDCAEKLFVAFPPFREIVGDVDAMGTRPRLSSPAATVTNPTTSLISDKGE